MNSVISRTARPWNFLPMECFPWTYDLNIFKYNINRLLLTNSKQMYAVWFYLFVLLFL